MKRVLTILALMLLTTQTFATTGQRYTTGDECVRADGSAVAQIPQSYLDSLCYDLDYSTHSYTTDPTRCFAAWYSGTPWKIIFDGSDYGVGGNFLTCTLATYSVGGSVSGLVTSGLSLQNGAGSPISVTSNGAFNIGSDFIHYDTYSVHVASLPSNTTCTVTNGSGTVATSNITNIGVSCTYTAPVTYSVGGTVSGLASSGLQLQDGTGSYLSVPTNGSYTITSGLSTGQTYSIHVASLPANTTCSVSAGSGTIASASITNANVSCTYTPPPTYSVGGTVTGLTTSGLTLQNGSSTPMSITSAGTFTIVSGAHSGDTYSVHVAAQPAHASCTVSNGAGTLSSSNVTNIGVACTTVSDPLASADPMDVLGLFLAFFMGFGTRYIL